MHVCSISGGSRKRIQKVGQVLDELIWKDCSWLAIVADADDDQLKELSGCCRAAEVTTTALRWKTTLADEQ